MSLVDHSMHIPQSSETLMIAHTCMEFDYGENPWTKKSFFLSPVFLIFNGNNKTILYVTWRR
jgi:hypothetical protein